MIGRRLIFAALLFSTPLIHAQDTDKTPHQASETSSTLESYLLTLTIKISDHGKVTTEQTSSFSANSRVTSNFPQMPIQPSSSNPSSRDGDRIPIATGSEGGKTQIQYIDIGTSIDILDVKKLGSSLSCNVRIEISSVVPSPSLKDDPIIRGSKFSLSPAIPLNKQVTIYSNSDSVTGRKVEIQLRAEAQPNF